MSIVDNKLTGTCTCQAFDQYGPCKHIAATGFAAIAARFEGYEVDRYLGERVEDLLKLKKVVKNFK